MELILHREDMMPRKTTSEPLSWSDAPDVLTVDEAARVLRLGRNGMYEMIRTGVVPAIKLGSSYRIAKSTLRGMMNPE